VTRENIIARIRSRASVLAARRRADRQAGFTLIELLVVLAIIAVLMSAAMAGLRSAKTATYARATIVTATSVGRAVSTFNRQYPVVGTTDQLLTRGGGAPFTSTQAEPSGLFSPGGERLLSPWPTNPYTDKPVVITRASAAACPTTGSPGTVAVCRVPAANGNAASFRVRAWARRADSSSYVVYDVQLS
jgi:prepilin-type N-terminal cleavage/methylation domain-containing protein